MQYYVYYFANARYSLSLIKCLFQIVCCTFFGLVKMGSFYRSWWQSQGNQQLNVKVMQSVFIYTNMCNHSLQVTGVKNV